MYRSVSNGPAHVRIFRALGSNQDAQFLGDPNTADYRNDVLFFPQGNTSGITCGIISDPMVVTDVIGVSSYEFDHPSDESFRTVKPLQVAWSRGLDWKNYGNPLGIGSFLANYPAAISNIEKQVVHPAFRGDVQDTYENMYLYEPPSTFDHLGLEIDVFGTRPLPHAMGIVEGTDINSQGFITFVMKPFGASSINIEADFWHVFNQIYQQVSFMETFSWSPVWYWEYIYTNLGENLSYKTDNHYHFEVEYDYEQHYGVNNLFSKYHVHLLFDVYIVPHNGSENPFVDRSISPECFSIVNGSSYSLIDIGGNYMPNYRDPILPAIAANTHGGPGFYTPLLQRDDSVASSRFYTFRRQGKNDVNYVFDQLRFHTQMCLPHLRPSAFFSASDALSKHIEVLSANHLENLSQLAGLLSILPNLSKLPRIVSKLTKGDPSAIVEAIDYVTDALIKFRFAQSPTVGDAIELATTDVLGELKSLLQSKTYTLYGDFFWEFPEVDNYMGDGRLVLATRSKINITVDMSTLLANYLTLNAMGVLPSLANVWETLPFSFIVDWFTNMDDRLESVDNQLLWMCVRTNWSLHSYKVSYFPSESMLSSYGLESPNSDEPFRITAYFRELSLIMPLLRESKFDFLAPNRGPDPLIVGALTWQKLRS